MSSTTTERRKALISVHDKSDLCPFAEQLVELGFDLISTGGTATALRAAGIPVQDVSEYTGFPEMMHGRVKTLHPKVHGGILALRDDQTHTNSMIEHGIAAIDLVVVNLYPFEATVAKDGVTRAEAIEQIDIGGPSMVRSAAKNHRFVGIVTDPGDYARVVNELEKENGRLSETLRRELALKAFATTAAYDAAITRWLDEQEVLEGATQLFLPKQFVVGGTLFALCKYGENPQQAPVGLYATNSTDPLALHRFVEVEGTEPSFVNLTDVDRVLQTMTHIAAGFSVNFGSIPRIAIGVKHGNACGSAVGDNEIEVVSRMVEGNPLAIFGGVVMVNFTLNHFTAEVLVKHGMGPKERRVLDAVIAPGFSDAAIQMLRRKNGRCRIITNPALGNLGVHSLDSRPRIRPVRGGFLVQPNYTFVLDLNGLTVEHLVPNGKTVNTQERRDVILAWAISATSTSNTISLVKNGMLIGNGVGQQDRVGAANLALAQALRAGHSTKGAVASSDSFFPFTDAPAWLADAGISLIQSTSGSIRDDEVKKFCGDRGVTLCLISDKLGRGFYGH
ncbi:MAG: bifunctional phosphoribosylaminoimidazolecarboxamide formyltransferase/IMP cyclohydrolase [Patescibacteria group bacterium]